ncbi:MAG: hypothetical protein JKY55_07985 [Aliivibrio sp.]|uniref:hypothetical protein n=1 Tax=Aliivibrio sp. TaxID=1872443 RepID=UPI001A5E16DD|nr:hypothetical protein [Aliivibrio sp.]
MSINSIDHDEIAVISSQYDIEKELSSKKLQDKANARRRIEAIKDIKESGLTLDEAREIGLIH